MSTYREEIDPTRLCEAAEAALAAANEVAEYTGGPRPYPADLMGSELQPPCLEPFTRWEIEQASEFLLRLGEIEARPHPKRAA